jgi:hypothetical protein
MAQEQVRTELEQAKNTWREPETSCKASIMEHAKLRRVIGGVLSELGVLIGPVLPEALLKLVEFLPEVVKEWEISTARRVVHRVLAMFDSHYQGLDRMALSSGWAHGSSDEHCDQLEEDYASFARDMADVAMKKLDRYQETHQKTETTPGLRIRCIIFVHR